MKNKLLLLAMLITGFSSFAQPKEISREWTAFVQTIDASFLKKQVKFRLTSAIKAIPGDSTAYAGMWARVDNKNGEIAFFDNMDERPVKSGDWRNYVIEGTMDANADKLNFGGLGVGNGKFFFDNFELHIENDKGQLTKVNNLDNASFEEPCQQNVVPGWIEGTRPLTPVRVKEFTFSSVDAAERTHALLLEGRGIVRDTTYMIAPAKGFTPQIGTLVMMLNNLSQRVEQTVRLLDQKETDYLMDEQANSIGALVMHLAAAEAYYQVYTFENRDFNDEEKKKWQVALDLGDQARKEIKGHDIEYYLNIYKEVRKKTIEELGKHNDEWLALARPGAEINNHFCWFHVMEHQSSHLGQILLYKKRLPKREGKTVLKISNDH